MVYGPDDTVPTDSESRKISTPLIVPSGSEAVAVRSTGEPKLKVWLGVGSIICTVGGWLLGI